MKQRVVDIIAELVHETPLAWLVDIGNEDAVWVPKSICEFDGEVLTIPEYLAIEKEML